MFRKFKKNHKYLNFVNAKIWSFLNSQKNKIKLQIMQSWMKTLNFSAYKLHSNFPLSNHHNKKHLHKHQGNREMQHIPYQMMPIQPIYFCIPEVRPSLFFKYLYFWCIFTIFLTSLTHINNSFFINTICTNHPLSENFSVRESANIIFDCHISNLKFIWHRSLIFCCTPATCSTFATVFNSIIYQGYALNCFRKSYRMSQLKK